MKLSGFKSTTRVLFLFLLHSTLLYHQDCEAGPQIEVPLQVVDLGEQLYYKKAEFAFSIKNTGDADLEATVGKTSCGCTVALPPDKALPPGSEGTINLEYRPKQDSKRLGPQDFTALINTNASNYPEFLLSLKVRLVEPVSSYPPALEFVASESDGEVKMEPLLIKCFQDEGLPQILSVSSTDSAFTVTSIKVEKSEAGEAHHYEVSLDSQHLGNTSSAALVFKTNSSRVPVLEIPIKVTKNWPLKFSPSTLLFGIVKGNTATEKITLADSIGPESELGTAVSSDPRIGCDLKVTPNGKWEIAATLKAGLPGTKPERIDATIDILDRNQHKIGEVPVKAIVASGAK